jgi:hypothetical protein
MLRELRLGGRGNSSMRATAIQRMQQTHGNRSVQRLIQRTSAMQSTPVPVQREEDPFKLKIDLVPQLKLNLPFGSGFGLGVTPSGVDLNWKAPFGKGKIGYEYGESISAEGDFGKGFGGKLQFDPSKKEGSIMGKAGGWWLGGGGGPKGYRLGGGYGGPLLVQPGLDIPPMIGDPTKDLRKGDWDPRALGKGADDINDKKLKPGWGFGGQVYKGPDVQTPGGTIPNYGVWGGVQYVPDPNDKNPFLPFF